MSVVLATLVPLLILVTPVLVLVVAAEAAVLKNY